MLMIFFLLIATIFLLLFCTRTNNVFKIFSVAVKMTSDKFCKCVCSTIFLQSIFYSYRKNSLSHLPQWISWRLQAMSKLFFDVMTMEEKLFKKKQKTIIFPIFYLIEITIQVAEEPLPSWRTCSIVISELLYPFLKRHKHLAENPNEFIKILHRLSSNNPHQRVVNQRRGKSYILPFFRFLVSLSFSLLGFVQCFLEDSVSNQAKVLLDCVLSGTDEYLVVWRVNHAIQKYTLFYQKTVDLLECLCYGCTSEESEFCLLPPPPKLRFV